MKTSFCFALVATLTLGMFSGSAQAADLKVGDKAPDFSLDGTDGKTYRLGDYMDKQVVVVAWFPKAKTRGCTAECKSFRASGKELRAYDVAYFTASCDTPEFNKEFSNELELDYPILSDPDKTTAKAYGVVDENRPLPQRWTFYIGTDGKILFIDKEVKTPDYGKDVAAKLAELNVPKK